MSLHPITAWLFVELNVKKCQMEENNENQPEFGWLGGWLYPQPTRVEIPGLTYVYLMKVEGNNTYIERRKPFSENQCILGKNLQAINHPYISVINLFTGSIIIFRHLLSNVIKILNHTNGGIYCICLHDPRCVPFEVHKSTLSNIQIK
jgi:hypothetical protein